MGEPRRAPRPEPPQAPKPPEPRQEPKPPAAQTAEDLGALNTACAVFDRELDRLVRLFQAREELRPVTAQVRELLAAVQPLQQRKDAIGAEIIALQATIAGWQEKTAQAEAQHAARGRENDEEIRQMRLLLEHTRSEVATERTALREALARERDAQQGELRTLMEVAEARKQDVAKMVEEAEAAHTQRLAAMHEEVARIQEQIEEAQRLREQLTAIRG